MRAQALAFVLFPLVVCSVAQAQTCGGATANQETKISGVIRVNGTPTEGVRITKNCPSRDNVCPENTTSVSDVTGRFSFVTLSGFRPGTFLGNCDVLFGFWLRAEYRGENTQEWVTHTGGWAPESINVECGVAPKLTCKIKSIKFAQDGDR